MKESIIEGPDIATMSVEETVRYYVETYGTDEHDARELVLAERGLLPVTIIAEMNSTPLDPADLYRDSVNE